jgi:carbonic anhydrase
LIKSPEMSEQPQHPPEPISVDGVLYAIVDGEWTQVGFAGHPKNPDAVPFALPEGHISVDGTVFAIVDGDWKHVGAAGRRNAGASRPAQGHA